MIKPIHCLLIFFISFESLAQDLTISNLGLPPIKTYVGSDYEGFDQVWDVIQNDNGLMYISTTTAIHEFDGLQWRRIETPGNRFGRCFTKSTSGKIYLGGGGASPLLGYLAPDSLGQIVFHDLSDKFDPFWDMGILEFVKSHNGILYAGTQSGVLVMDEITEIIRYFHIGEKSYPNFVLNNEMHFVAPSHGVLRMGDTLELAPNGESLKNMAVSDVVVKKDRATVISPNSGLYQYSYDSTFRIDAFDEEWLIANYPYKAAKLSNEYNVICFLKSGMVITDSNWKPVLWLGEHEGVNNQVHKAFLDANNNLWLATNVGLSLINLNAGFTTFNEENGLKGTVFSMIEMDDYFYAGTSTGLYQKAKKMNPLSTTDNHFQLVDNSGIYNYHILKHPTVPLVKAYESIGQIRNGSFVSLIEGSSQRSAIVYLSENTALTTGDNANTLELFQFDGNTWKYKKSIPNDVLPRYLFFMTVDQTNNFIWGYNAEQLVAFRLNEDLTEVEYFKEYTDAQTLPGVQKIQIRKVADETLFLTKNGIYTFDQGTDAFTKDNRFGNYFDEDGLYYLNKQNDSLYWYHKDLPERGYLATKENDQVEANSRVGNVIKGTIQSFLLDEQNNMWFGGKGAYIFNSSKKEPSGFAFPPAVRKVELISGEDSTIFSGLFPNGTDWTASPTDTYEFPSIKNAFRFEYSLADYRTYSPKSFQYQLVGFDKEWSEWSDKNQKEYTNLPPGDYEFQVRARNIFGDLSDIGRFPFSISKPWHLTAVAFALYGTLSIGFIILIVRINTKRLRIQNQKLEQIVEERTAEILKQNEIISKSLEERESLLKEIHHRVKNNLQIIASLLYLQSGRFDDADFKKVLEEGQGRVRSMALIHQKLYENDDLKSIPFGEYLQELLREIQTSFGSTAENVKLEIETDMIHFDVETAIPLGLIVNELATNAFKYAYDGKKQGTFHISLINNGGQYVLTVSDNGKGMPDEVNTRKSKSLGLRLVKMLSIQLEGEYAFNSSNGTKFELRFAA